MLPYTERLPPLVEMFELTARVDDSVVAPVTASVFESVVAPVTARVDWSVEAPVRVEAPATARVPAIDVLPLADKTENLLVLTVKSPVVLTAAFESWSAESVPPPSLTVLRVLVREALSEVLSRPV